MDKITSPKWRKKCFDFLEKIEADSKMPASKNSSSELLKNKEALENKLTLQKEQLKQTQKTYADLRSECDQENTDRYRMQLYQLISNIKWDLDSPPNEVKGFISKPFDVFELNTEIDSRYYISNHLWELMGEDVKDAITHMRDLNIEENKENCDKNDN